MLLWLWYRLAAAAPIQALGQELPNAMGAALKIKSKQNKTKQKRSPGPILFSKPGSLILLECAGPCSRGPLSLNSKDMNSSLPNRKDTTPN